MGFWSTLAGIGGAIAAPFTGGLSLLAGPAVSALTGGGSSNPTNPNVGTTAGNIGQTAGSIEQQRLNALIQQTLAQQRQDQLNQSRALLGLSAPASEAHNSVQGDILANAQDFSLSGLPKGVTVPTMSGGLRPSLLSPASRALGANMSRNALLNNLSGKDVPALTPLPAASAYDKILQGVAQGGGFLNAANGLFNGATGGTGQITGFVPGDVTNGPMIDPENPDNAIPNWWDQLPGGAAVMPGGLGAG